MCWNRKIGEKKALLLTVILCVCFTYANKLIIYTIYLKRIKEMAGEFKPDLIDDKIPVKVTMLYLLYLWLLIDKFILILGRNFLIIR